MSRELPSGTVTFVFTDIEGSTRVLRELGAEAYAGALAEHRRILREAFAAHGGVEVDTQGDALFYAFATAPGALQAAAEAQAVLAAGPIRVRIGIHTGTPLLSEEGYVGEDVHRAARIAASGHGGQVLVSAATASLLEADGLRDLGEHRLKDLGAPERIYQAGADDFLPLKTLYRTNLPIAVTPFVGRARELAEVGALLARKDVRLLTLTGPGGTGKTRLALQAAAEAAERYPDGVFWVPLSSLRDPALVLEQASQVLGAKGEIAAYLGDRNVLLVLDNVEHLLGAAADIAALLQACPNLRVLVTSRELLRVPGEQAYPVPPLAAADGVELFLARARAADPAFVADEVVSELCARLEQLPLALELAAARVRVLTPRQLLERVSQQLDLLKAGRAVDPRQQTLRATIDWSHELLDPNEQRLFARLSVVAGGCTLDAAEQVCDADLDTLQSLVDKSLLRHGGERFWMLESIRGYADERLDAPAEADELRERHADYFFELVESAPGAAESDALSANVADTSMWRQQIGADYENVRAALAWFRASGDIARELRLAFVVAWLYLWMRGGFAEAAGWFASLLERSGALAPQQRVDALQSLAHFGQHLPWEERRNLAEQSLALARSLGDEGRTEWALRRLGNVWIERDSQEARRILLECEPLARRLPERGRLAWIQQNIGLLALLEGDYDEARRRLEESVSLFEDLGGEWQALNALDGLVMTAAMDGRPADAGRIVDDFLPRAVKAGALMTVADFLVQAAALALGDGRPKTAATLLGAVATIRKNEGFEFGELEAALLTRTEGTARQLLDADFEPILDEGRRLTVDEAVELALAEKRDASAPVSAEDEPTHVIGPRSPAV